MDHDSKGFDLEAHNRARVAAFLQTECDTALARVKELDGAFTFYRRVAEKHVDELSSDVQCAKLASELASKEREALRQLVIEQREIIKDFWDLYPAPDLRKTVDSLEQRATELLGTEEAK